MGKRERDPLKGCKLCGAACYSDATYCGKRCSSIAVKRGFAARPSRTIEQVDELFRTKYRIDESGCWIWLTAKNKRSYGQFSFQLGDGTRKRTRAHRLSYELVHGPIPDGLHIDHLCCTPACCNPAHLEPVTSAENTRRWLVSLGRTSCVNGHPFEPDNVYRPPNGRGRACRECKRASDRRRWANRAQSEVSLGL